jgi:general secretion pathway protein C
MGLDGQLKRFYPLLLCGLIALAAYFQSSGIGQLMVSTIVAGTEPTEPPALSKGAVAKTETKSGDPVLSRNPFDSVTGSLIGNEPEPIPGGPVPDLPDAKTSDEDPDCGFGRVVLISANADPDWSFAAIEDGSGNSKLRRLGESVGSHTIQAFGWDRVWLAQGSQVCQMKLGVSAAKAPAKKRTSKRPTRRRRRGRQLPAEMASKINKVSETEYTVERSVVDEIMENQAELMRSARILPEKEGDKVVGIRLFGIRNGTLLNHLGMKNGDRLESINGFNMSDPQKALEAYGRLRTADALKVKINRKGTPMTLEFKIQ